MGAVTLEKLHEDIEKLYGEIRLIKDILREELSDETKKSLAEARKIPDSELISHKEARKRILGE